MPGQALTRVDGYGMVANSFPPPMGHGFVTTNLGAGQPSAVFGLTESGQYILAYEALNPNFPGVVTFINKTTNAGSSATLLTWNSPGYQTFFLPPVARNQTFQFTTTLGAARVYCIKCDVPWDEQGYA